MLNVPLFTVWGHQHLTAFDNYLKFWIDKEEIIIPYNQIVSFKISKPKGRWTNGMIQINVGGAVKSQLRMISNYVTNNTNDIQVYYTIDNLHIIEEFKEFLTMKLAEANSPDKIYSFSPADEIKKFKELLDAGIITKEEFEIKKKELLGI